jgi:hypothetical protein
MTGAIAFIMAAWLSFDAYRLRHDSFVLLRTIGFSLCAVWYLIHALTLGNDLLSYVGIAIFGLGLLCVVSSFLKKSELLVHAIIVIPSFSLLSRHLYGISAVALCLISYLAFRQWKREQNPTWIPFSLSFLLIGAASFLGVFVTESNQTNVFFVIRILIEFVGFVILGYWVWQYMRLRINESVMMISVGVTFLLATIVTLAFSTILIGRVTAETARNLITDVKVLDLSINTLKSDALAKAELVSREADISNAITKNDFSSLSQVAEKLLQKYNLGFLTITDADGSVLVRANALSRRGDSLSGERAFEEAYNKNVFVTIEESPVEGFSIRAGSPILLKEKVVGVVVAGYQLDNAFVDQIKRVTGLEMFIYKDDISISGTAFAIDGTRRLTGISLTDKSLSASVLEDGKTVTGNIEMYGEPFQASYAPLSNEDGKIVGMLSAAKHQQDIINIANATNRLTLITVILILLILLAPIYFLAQRLTSDSLI